MVFLPSRVEIDFISTELSVSGADCADNVSNRSRRAFALVVRALAPRLTHSSSWRRMLCRLRSDAAALAMRSALRARNPS